MWHINVRVVPKILFPTVLGPVKMGYRHHFLILASCYSEGKFNFLFLPTSYTRILNDLQSLDNSLDMAHIFQKFFLIPRCHLSVYCKFKLEIRAVFWDLSFQLSLFVVIMDAFRADIRVRRRRRPQE